MNKGLMFSSATCEWATPPELFKALDAEFGFTCDVYEVQSRKAYKRTKTRE